MADPKQLLNRINAEDRTKCDEGLCSAMDAWKKQIEEVEATRSLLDSFVIQGIVKRLNEEIKTIEGILIENRQLANGDPIQEYHARLSMLDRKAMYRDFLSTFDVDGQLESIAKKIDENL